MPNRKITSNSGKTNDRNRDVIFENPYIQLKDNKVTKLKGTSIIEYAEVEVRKYLFPDGSYLNIKVPCKEPHNLDKVLKGGLFPPELWTLREVIDRWKLKINKTLCERLKTDNDIRDFVYDMICIQDNERTKGRLFPSHTNKSMIEKWFYKGNMPKGKSYANYRAALSEAVYSLAVLSGLRINLLTDKQKIQGSYSGFITENNGIVTKFKRDEYREFIQQALLVINLSKNSSLRKANWDTFEFGNE